MTIAIRVKALRAALGLTQEKVALAGGLGRLEVVKVETGKNQATTDHIRAGLARAFGISRDDFAEYIGGAIDITEVLQRRKLALVVPPKAQTVWEYLFLHRYRVGTKRLEHDVVLRAEHDNPNGPPFDGWDAALNRAAEAVKPPHARKGRKEEYSAAVASKAEQDRRRAETRRPSKTPSKAG